MSDDLIRGDEELRAIVDSGQHALEGL